MAACMPSFGSITWQRLQDEDSITYPVDDDGVSQEIMFREGFPTATGRENSFRPTSYRPTRCRTMIFRYS